MEVELAFTGVPVTDLATGHDFFERLLGRPADVEVAVDEVMWRINGAAWLYVVVDPDRAGRGLVALSVADLEASLAELERRGLRPQRMDDVGGGPKATLLDADGNTVALISVPTEPPA